jgi:hypothetical protein
VVDIDEFTDEHLSGPERIPTGPSLTFDNLLESMTNYLQGGLLLQIVDKVQIWNDTVVIGSDDMNLDWR